MAPDTCPNCGADLSRNAKVCPECGSDENTGWSDDAKTQALDLPDEDFDYDEFAKRTFGEEEKVKTRGVSWLWWAVACAIVAGFVALLLWSR